MNKMHTESPSCKCEDNLSQDGRQQVVTALEWSITSHSLEVQGKIVCHNKNSSGEQQNRTAARPHNGQFEYGQRDHRCFSLVVIPDTKYEEHSSSTAEKSYDLGAFPRITVPAKLKGEEDLDGSRCKESESNKVKFRERSP